MGGASTENRVIGRKAKGENGCLGKLGKRTKETMLSEKRWKREKYKDSIDTSYLFPLKHMGETLNSNFASLTPPSFICYWFTISLISNSFRASLFRTRRSNEWQKGKNCYWRKVCSAVSAKSGKRREAIKAKLFQTVSGLYIFSMQLNWIELLEWVFKLD